MSDAHNTELLYC